MITLDDLPSYCLKGDSMAEQYQQFLGSRPGLLVEILDQSTTPYRARTEDGFEFFVSADDFRNYYRKEDAPVPQRWRHLITDSETEMIDSGKMAEVLGVVHLFSEAFQDYEKARVFVREAVRSLGDDPNLDVSGLREQMNVRGWNTADVMDEALDRLFHIREDIRLLLLSDSCGVIQFASLSLAPGNGVDAAAEAYDAAASGGVADNAAERKPTGPQTRRAGMKNVEMTVEGDILTLTVDVSKEFGPSKSGKTIIVASTEGNKSVPGRNEKVGLNIYKKEEEKKVAVGRKSSFKNVEMELQGTILKITVILSQEFGPSKSGKTTIIGSTEGNQLVFGRPEKIGLNVYKKID
jgi:hypothetical protein